MRVLIYASALILLSLSNLGSATLPHEPFGRLTIPTTEWSGGVFERHWNLVKTLTRGQEKELNACDTSLRTCTPAAKRYLELVAETKQFSGLGQLKRVHELLHHSVKYLEDKVQWMSPDRWSPPLETLGIGKGDCEDYAILVYYILRDAGFSTADLRIVVGDLILEKPVVGEVELHAVTAVRHDARWWIIDINQSKIWEDEAKPRYKPRYVFDEKSARQY